MGGRAYTVSCADGEEAHVRRLASIVDGKIAALGGGVPPGDAKNLLFAALILADEVDEARRTAVPSKSNGADAMSLADNVTRGLEALADRLESVASELETGRPNP